MYGKRILHCTCCEDLKNFIRYTVGLGYQVDVGSIWGRFWVGTRHCRIFIPLVEGSVSVAGLAKGFSRGPFLPAPV